MDDTLRLCNMITWPTPNPLCASLLAIAVYQQPSGPLFIVTPRD